MNFSIDEYESVGERAAYQNTVLADEAKRDTISSPQVTTIIPSSHSHCHTTPHHDPLSQYNLFHAHRWLHSHDRKPLGSRHQS